MRNLPFPASWPRFSLVALVLCLAGCTDSVDPFAQQDCLKSVKIAHIGGNMHGAGCTKDSECEYGICSMQSLQAAGVAGVGVCTKDCSCGAGSACSDDDEPSLGLAFTCIKVTKGAGSECARSCVANADCQNYNPKLPFCVTGVAGIFTAGAQKVCSAKPQS